MPKVSQEIETVEVPAVHLEPEVEQAVRDALVDYQRIQQQVDTLTAILNRRKQEVAEALEQSGKISCVVDNISMTWVFPIKSTLDKKKLLAQGVTLAQIKAATVETPSKEYFRIYLPKEKK